MLRQILLVFEFLQNKTGPYSFGFFIPNQTFTQVSHVPTPTSHMDLHMTTFSCCICAIPTKHSLSCITFPLLCLIWIFIYPHSAVVSVHFQPNIHLGYHVPTPMSHMDIHISIFSCCGCALPTKHSLRLSLSYSYVSCGSSYVHIQLLCLSTSNQTLTQLYHVPTPMSHMDLHMTTFSCCVCPLPTKHSLRCITFPFPCLIQTFICPLSAVVSKYSPTKWKVASSGNKFLCTNFSCRKSVQLQHPDF